MRPKCEIGMTYEETNKYGLKVGDVVKTNISGDVKILSLDTPKDVLIRFLGTGNERSCDASCLSRGEVKDLIYGRGYIYNVPIKDELGKIRKEYDCWRRMLHRTHVSWWEVHPTYTGATLSDEWFCYDNFYQWYQENCPDTSWDLDKDLLSFDELRYSPLSCCFLPEEVNKAITYRANPLFSEKKDKGRFEFYFRKKYIACSKSRDGLKPLYAEKKNEYVRSLADEYPYLKGHIRDALTRYTLVSEGTVVRRVA